MLPALVAAALAAYPAGDALAASKHRPAHSPAAVAPQAQPPRAAAYEADGTPIATGEPRRLSSLAARGHTLAMNRSATRKPARAQR
jgi:hypothetical protein